MNEKIKELAEQAGLTFVNAITDDNEDIECVADTDGGLPCSTELEKFAELIIQDCMDVVDGYTKGRTFDTHYDAVVQIETLFGIKHNGIEE